MHHRQVPALGGVNVVRGVGVQRGDDGDTLVHGPADVLRGAIDDGLGLSGAEAAVDEVVLHVHDDQKSGFAHGGNLPLD